MFLLNNLKDLPGWKNQNLLMVHGCCVGYKDAEFGLPHHNPPIYVASMAAAESIFTKRLCEGFRGHQPLEGAPVFGPRKRKLSLAR